MKNNLLNLGSDRNMRSRLNDKNKICANLDHESAKVLFKHVLYMQSTSTLVFLRRQKFALDH